MQNHYEITLKTKFWIRAVRNWTQSRKYEPIWAHMGPARALEESVGPARVLEESVGPARALEELFLFNTFLGKNICFLPPDSFFNSFNVLLNFLAEI